VTLNPNPFKPPMLKIRNVPRSYPKMNATCNGLVPFVPNKKELGHHSKTR